MEKLRCPACAARFTEQPHPHLPLVLPCGHTFCQRCIEGSLSQGALQCPACRRALPPLDRPLPVNECLLEMLQEARLGEEEACRAHGKKYDVYCEKCREPICVECTLTTHSRHKATMVAAKVAADRAALRDALLRNQESHEESRRALEQLKGHEAAVESAFLDSLMEASVFYKHIIEAIAALQEKELERIRREKEDILRRIEDYRAEALEKQAFHQKLQEIFAELEAARELEFLRRENQQSFILNNCRAKKEKHVLPVFEFRRVNCLQEIIACLQEMNNFEKKKILHSNSVLPKEKEVHGSPSLKKAKEPAVLEVNLSEEYNRRKANQQKEAKSSRPAKKVINISSDKERVGEAVALGQPLPKPPKTSELKYIRESSIKKREQQDSLFLEELELSHNCTPLSASSFMRSSRDSQVSLPHDSIKHSFNSFSLLESEERVYLFGGRVPSKAEKFSWESGQSEKVGVGVSRRGLQAVRHRPYSLDSCLLIGGTAVTAGESDTLIYEFSFKLERLSKTPFHLPHPRSSFGCVSRGEALYLLGGRHKEPLSSFERLELGAKGAESTRLPSMVQAREGLGCCLGFDGWLYAAGGVNKSNNILNSCERFSWERGAWESLQHMREQRRGFALVAVPHGLFAIGGHSPLAALASVELFDFNRGEWVAVASMAEARCHHSAVLSHDYQTITVFGGFADSRELDSIEVYEIAGNRWRGGGRLRERRSQHASVSYQ